jgi:hypothetical protein
VPGVRQLDGRPRAGASASSLKSVDSGSALRLGLLGRLDVSRGPSAVSTRLRRWPSSCWLTTPSIRSSS